MLISKNPKNKLKKFLIKKLLIPAIGFVLLFAIIVGSVVEVPKAIGRGIAEFFSGGEEDDASVIREVSLFELRDYFRVLKAPPEIEDFQTSQLLVEFIDMQIASGIFNVKSYVTTETYVNGQLKNISKVPITLTFDTTPYTAPWQFMSAIDIANENLKTYKPSQESKQFYEMVRPTFDGKLSSEFVPVHAKVTTITTNKLRTVYKEGEATASANAEEEMIVIREPLPIIGTINYHGGSLKNTIENQTHSKTYSNSETSSFVFGDVVTDTTTTVVVDTPIVKEQNFNENSSTLIAAMNASVPKENRDLLMQLLQGYPFMESFSVFFTEAYESYVPDGGVGPIVDVEQPKLTYNFRYPELKRSKDGKLYREDVIKLALSVQGLDYFWGGKHPAVGFNKNWGTPRYVFAAGHPASGTYTRFGFDCSGFTEWVYYNVGQKIGGIRTMIMSGKFKEVSLSQLEPGDLATYNNYSRGETANHIGIYLGYENGKHLFIHCGGYAWATRERPHGQVIISALNQNYNGFPGVNFKRFYKYKRPFAD